jgi:rhodanese-related sulfurtransferase/DNA-directed RNA polymerase subunit RPC12/RpoP
MIHFMKPLAIIAFCLSLFSSTGHKEEKYKCMPCGRDCDNTIHSAPGKCASCHMDLVKSDGITFKNIEPALLCDYIKAHPKTILLDVRTKEEFEGKANPNFGSLKNAINIPIQELKNRVSQLESYKDREILVYCSHSHRSPQAAYQLSQLGFKQIKNMSGGMSELKDKDCKK